MRVGLIAKKIGMSRFYDSAGLNHPVTILEVDNCKVIETKTYEKHGFIHMFEFVWRFPFQFSGKRENFQKINFP